MKSFREIVEKGEAGAMRDALRSARTLSELDEGLRVAIRRGDKAGQELIVSGGADVNFARKRDGWRPLHSAVEHRQKETIRLLVASGGDLNLADGRGATPLHLAVDVEADTAHQLGGLPGTDLIELLLELGADRHTSDIEGKTARDWAHEYEHGRAVSLLEG